MSETIGPELSAKRRAASLARKTFAAGPGRPKSAKKRCFCGAQTLKRAYARGFKCCRDAGKII